MVRMLVYETNPRGHGMHPAYAAMLNHFNQGVTAAEYRESLRAELDRFGARWCWSENMDRLELEFPGEDERVMWCMAWG